MSAVGASAESSQGAGRSTECDPGEGSGDELGPQLRVLDVLAREAFPPRVDHPAVQDCLAYRSYCFVGWDWRSAWKIGPGLALSTCSSMPSIRPVGSRSVGVPSCSAANEAR